MPNKISGLSSSDSGPASATVKCGWVEKYSVGRGFFPVRNWKKRWLMVTHQGLNYSKDQGTSPSGRTYIPFVSQGGNSATAAGGGGDGGGGGRSGGGMSPSKGSSSSTNLVALMAAERDRMSKGGVCMNPVFLFPTVSATIHPEASAPEFFYFGLRFEETETPRILLLRSSIKDDREAWVRFIGQFVHAASVNGIPNMHPAIMKAPKIRDPEELDPRSLNEVRRNVMGWDDGFQYRAFGAEAPCENMYEECPPPMNWDSDNETETNGVSSPRESQLSGAAATAGAPAGRTATGGGDSNTPPAGGGASRRDSEEAMILGTAGGGGDHVISQQALSPFPEPTQLGLSAATGGTGAAQYRDVSPDEYDDCL